MREIPPPLELECLKALWSLGEGSVRDVLVALTRDKNLAYTTVMTILDRLAKKQRVKRRKVGRSFVYSPVLTRDELRRLAVRELVDSFFDGSEQGLIAYLERGKTAERYAAGPEPLDTALL
jgi:predicted transcriptional regulator